MRRLLRAEWGKQKMWPLGIITVAGPLFLLLLAFLAIQYGRSGGNAWVFIVELWSTTSSYLIITLIFAVSGLVAGIEHKYGMWPRLLLYPCPKWMHLAVKWIWVMVPVQVFGLLTGLLMMGLAAIGPEPPSGLISSLYPLFYLPFVLALPYLLVQTVIATVIENTFVSTGIGLAIFLFHGLLSYGLVPWGPLLYGLHGNPGLSGWLFFLIDALGYGAIGIWVFYQKTFTSGVE